MTCCVIPYFVGCILPCWLGCDRAAMASRYNIEDPWASTAWLLFCCGCGTCLLCQEYNTMKHFEATGVSSTVRSGGAHTCTAWRTASAHRDVPAALVRPAQTQAGQTTVIMMPGAPAVVGQAPRM